MKKRILVRVDFQNDFVDPDGKLTINDVALINRHQRFCNSLQRGMFAEVIDIADTHFEETYAATAEAADYPLHAAYYTWGWHKAAEFKDNIPLTNLYKSTTNIWNEENNYTLLRQDWRDKDIYLCGLLSDVCVREAMDGFLNRGAKVTLLEDLCKGVRQQLPEIIAEPQYAEFLTGGQLRMMNSAQFLKMILNEKKQQFNLAKRGKEI